MANRQHFETAVTAVCAWLENDANRQNIKRAPHRRDDDALAWNIDLQGDFPGVPAVRLVLPATFPAQACWFEVDPRLELKLPHVERGGKLCLRVLPSQADYDDPIGAVLRAIELLQKEFLSRLIDPVWSETEFHHERLTYWGLHCSDPRRATRVERHIGQVYLDASGLRDWADGLVAGYLRPSTKHGRFLRQVVTCNGTDPVSVARRHEWAGGTLVKGHALVVRLPTSQHWTPSTWPRTSQALDEVIQRNTHGERSLEDLLATARPSFQKDARARSSHTDHQGRQSPKSHAPPQLFVLFVQDGAVFGYQVRPTYGLSTRNLAIESFQVSRVDADWSLARDSALPQLHQRRAMRVLLLGAGSLGSPVAQLLARAGLGTLTIVDSELMEPENTSRHALGLPHIDVAKAPQLAQELRRLIPGLEVKGFQSEACSWLVKNAQLDTFDLVIDCTAESYVRTFIAMTRAAMLGATPVIHAWLEPLCSAGHVVLTQTEVPWPPEDPADSLVHASDISAEDTKVAVPACSAGFHLYGAADVTQVAAFTVERILAVLAAPGTTSTVWSWVRSQAFFDSLGMGVKTRSIVPKTGGALDTGTVTRPLAQVLGLQ